MRQFLTDTSIARIIIAALILGIVISGYSCNGDDPPKPPQPIGLEAVNGEFYRGNMGGTLLDKPLEFGVKNYSGDYEPDRWIHFSLLEGDGTLSADSLKSGNSGLVTLEYNFSGSLGHAAIRAIARNIDTVEVYLRADVLIPGVGGQGQYVRLDDTYQDILDFNGTPVSHDIFDGIPIVVVNYEATKGVVFVVDDADTNGVLEPSSEVLSIIVVDSIFLQPDSTTYSARYEGTTIDGLGIGSHWWNDFVPVYGFPNFVHTDNSDPELPTLKVIYEDLNMTLWSRQSDSTIYQIDLTDPL